LSILKEINRLVVEMEGPKIVGGVGVLFSLSGDFCPSTVVRQRQGALRLGGPAKLVGWTLKYGAYPLRLSRALPRQKVLAVATCHRV
jgi:hypothetical protein